MIGVTPQIDAITILVKSGKTAENEDDARTKEAGERRLDRGLQSAATVIKVQICGRRQLIVSRHLR